MGGFRVVIAVGAALLTASCVGSPTMDLSANEALYQPTGYHAAVAADVPVFVAPVVDRRGSRAAEASTALPVEYLPENAWARPMAAQVDRVLRDELERSGVFGALLPRATADAPVLQVELQQADAAIEENVDGRRSFSRVELHARLLGPASGERPVVWEGTADAAKTSPVTMHPPSPRLLLGAALRDAMLKLLLELDQSNVGRSHVPTSPH